MSGCGILAGTSNGVVVGVLVGILVIVLDGSKTLAGSALEPFSGTRMFVPASLQKCLEVMNFDKYWTVSLGICLEDSYLGTFPTTIRKIR